MLYVFSHAYACEKTEYILFYTQEINPQFSNIVSNMTTQDLKPIIFLLHIRPQPEMKAMKHTRPKNKREYYQRFAKTETNKSRVGDVVSRITQTTLCGKLQGYRNEPSSYRP